MKSLNSGVFMAVLAAFFWGFAPLYWDLLRHIPSDLVLVHRLLWSSVLLVGVISFKKSLIGTLKLLKNRKNILFLLLSSFALCVSWYSYIWAISKGFLTELGIGGYFTALISLILGRLFFKEKVNEIQLLGVILAVSGISFKIYQSDIDNVWGIIAGLVQALTVAIYGMMKKVTSNIKSLEGLTLETIIILPFILVFLLYITETKGYDFFYNLSPAYIFIILLSGLVTIIPLLLLSLSATKISLSLLGFTYYIPPTMVVILGFIKGSRLSVSEIAVLIFILLGVIVFLYGNRAKKYKKL